MFGTFMERVRVFLKQFFFYSFSYEELIKVKPLVEIENLRYVRIWSTFELLYWTFCFFMSFHDTLYKMCREVYVFAFIIALIALLLSFFARNKKHALLYPAMVCVSFSLLLAGVFIALRLAPKTIVIFASTLIVPVMFINSTFFYIILLGINIILFSVLGQSMDFGTYSWVLSNQILFSSLGIILGHFVNKARFERYVFAESAVELAALRTKYAYYDDLTGLRNRRSYEEQISEFRVNMPSDIWVIIVDINGLKETNDTFGHKAGDELIVGAAECLKKSFGDIDSIYRIGGDEFCVMASGTEEYIKDCLDKLESHNASWQGDFIDSISVSYGFVFSHRYETFDNVLRAADKEMYEFKREYYMNSDNDRRHR